jgi:hypothetical protein
MLRLVRIASASAALSSCAHASGKLDLLTSLTGDWEIVNEQAPDTSQSCDKAQRFAVSKNKREILLTEDWTTFSELYRVVWVEDTRILTIIEGEDRRNDKGDPILWWFYFDGKDSFQFRQYDWPPDTATTAVWKRCVSKK